MATRRTNIALTDRQHAFLKEESWRTGLPIAELIRRAVDATYRPHERERVRGVEISLGVWREPDAAVAGRRPVGPGPTPTLLRALRSRRARGRPT